MCRGAGRNRRRSCRWNRRRKKRHSKPNDALICFRVRDCYLNPLSSAVSLYFSLITWSHRIPLSLSQATSLLSELHARLIYNLFLIERAEFERRKEREWKGREGRKGKKKLGETDEEADVLSSEGWRRRETLADLSYKEAQKYKNNTYDIEGMCTISTKKKSKVEKPIILFRDDLEESPDEDAEETKIVKSRAEDEKDEDYELNEEEEGGEGGEDGDDYQLDDEGKEIKTKTKKRSRADSSSSSVPPPPPKHKPTPPIAKAPLTLAAPHMPYSAAVHKHAATQLSAKQRIMKRLGLKPGRGF